MKIIENNEAAEFYHQINEIDKSDPNYNSKIQKLRVVLEGIFNELTGYNQKNFKDLNDRMNFVFQKYNISERSRKKMHAFRIFGNMVVHGDIQNTSYEDYNKKVKDICNFIKEISDQDIPTDLSKSISKNRFNINISKILLLLILIFIGIYLIYKTDPFGVFSKPKQTTNALIDFPQREPISSKHIYCACFEPITSTSLLEKIKNSLSVNPDDQFVLITSQGRQKLNIDSSKLENFQYKKSDWSEASSILKSVFHDLPDDSNSVKKLFIIGNFPNIPDDLINKDNLMLNKVDFEHLTSKGHVTIYFVNQSLINDVSQFFIDKINLKKLEGAKLDIQTISF